MKNFIYLFVFTLLGLSLNGQTPKKVLVEHFTNSWCSICAIKNPAFYSLLEQQTNLIHIAYHPSRPYPGCIFSQHNTAENDARTNYYSIYGSTPRVVVNGDVIKIQSPTLMSSDLDVHLNQTSSFRIDVKQEIGPDDSILVQTSIYKIAASMDTLFDLYVQLVEKQVDYEAPNGEKVHHDVFRKTLLKTNVSLVSIDDSVIFIRKYAYHPDWKADQMMVVAFIQNPTTKYVLQAEESNLLQNQSNAIADYDRSTDFLVYPNPAHSYIQLKSEFVNNYEKVEIFNLQGEVVLIDHVQQRIDIAKLMTGAYIIRFSGHRSEPIYSRFMKY